MRKRLIILATAGALVVALAAVTAGPASADPTRTYEVTITNLTEGQPLTPPAVATHKKQADVFEVGEAASFGVKEIAENGNLTPLLDALAAAKGVSVAFVAPGGPLVPSGTPGAELPPNPPDFGDSTTFTISGGPGAKYITFVSMLICTNDGFTGVDSLRLPKKVGDVVTATTAGYDAGTEINTEDFADMVPPCQGLIGVSSSDVGTGMSDPALAEGGVIAHHPGIAGGDDLLPSVHGWDDPVALITIERVG